MRLCMAARAQQCNDPPGHVRPCKAQHLDASCETVPSHGAQERQGMQSLMPACLQMLPVTKCKHHMVRLQCCRLVGRHC